MTEKVGRESIRPHTGKNHNANKLGARYTFTAEIQIE